MRHLLGATAVEESAARISMRPSFSECVCWCVTAFMCVCVCVRIAAVWRTFYVAFFIYFWHRQRVKNNE